MYSNQGLNVQGSFAGSSDGGVKEMAAPLKTSKSRKIKAFMITTTMTILKGVIFERQNASVADLNNFSHQQTLSPFAPFGRSLFKLKQRLVVAKIR